MSHISFPTASRAVLGTLPDLLTKYNEAVRVLNNAMTGKLNAVNNHDFPLTLTASATTTTLTDARLSSFSMMLFDPLTANAAAELAAGTMYILAANRRNGVWTVTHANNVQTDRTFNYVILG